MIQEKTQKKVLKVIEGLKADKSLTQALKAAKMTRGHYYSARDAMRKTDSSQLNFAIVKSFMNSEDKPQKENAVISITPKPSMNLLHSQALRENERLKWAEELIEEIKGTQKRQAEILKKLMA